MPDRAQGPDCGIDPAKRLLAGPKRQRKISAGACDCPKLQGRAIVNADALRSTRAEGAISATGRKHLRRAPHFSCMDTRLRGRYSVSAWLREVAPNLPPYDPRRSLLVHGPLIFPLR